MRFFYNPEDRLWIYDNLKRVCDEGKQIMFLNNIHNNDLEKDPLPSPLWNIVFDMPKEAVKPTIIFNTDCRKTLIILNLKNYLFCWTIKKLFTQNYFTNNIQYLFSI